MREIKNKKDMLYSPIFLKPKYFDKAREIGKKVTGERNQWKTYLSAIALLAFEEWLQKLAPDIQLEIDNSSIFQTQYQTLIDAVCNIKFSNLKLCLIPIDILADSWITVPENIINSPELAAHLYILLEVIEDEKELIFRGFMYRDEILEYQQSANFTGTKQHSNSFKIPLFCFDTEINNFLIYSRFLEPNAITLPQERIIGRTVTPNTNGVSNVVTQSLINLEQWWSGVFEEGWQSLEEILTPQMPDWGCLRSKNSPEYPIQKGKLFDFGSLIKDKRFALVVKMKPEENQEKDVILQILPENEYCLPQDLKLKVTLNHNTNETETEEAIATESDYIIQIGFHEVSGKQFKVEAIYQDAVITQEFVL